jgi:UPF0755 protein
VGGDVVSARVVGWVAFAVAAAAVAAGTFAYIAAERWYLAPMPTSSVALVIEIEPGEPLASVARRLAAQGILDHPKLWALLARRDGKDAKIRAGEYSVAAGTSPLGLLDQFVEGRVQLHPVTLVEGWTVAAALAAIAANPVVHRTLEEGAAATLMARLGEGQLAAEGELFPDTYLVPRGTTDLEVVKLAHERLKQELAAAWDARKPGLPLLTDYQALVLASIVEKESAIAEERPRIAAVFINRLRRGMKLQTDPTVIYGLGSKYDGTVHHRDLQTDTPYNTYTREGLPPTPIALAGRESLRAAVQPVDSQDLYFVATGKGDGRHEFSSTNQAQNAAVARYLARLRRSSPVTRGR